MEKNELEIKVTDIIASFLKSIVLIVAITAFFTALLGGYGYYRAKKATVNSAFQEDVDTAAEKVAAKEFTIQNLEHKNETINEVNIPYYTRKIERDRALNEKRRAYLETSLYYSIDPFNCGTARITFAVDAPIPEGAAEEYANYKANEQRRIVNDCAVMYPFSDEILENVKQILGTDADKRYIEELISVSNVEDQFVRLEVYYSDLSLAKKAADYLYSEIVKILRDLDPTYKVTIVNSFNGYEVNRDMYDSRTRYEDNILSSERSLTSDSDTLNNLNKNIEDNLTNLSIAKEELSDLKRDLESAESKLSNANSSRSPKRSVLKFAIVGCKIRSRNNLLSRFPYPLLGVAPATKRIFFDKTIKNLEGDPTYSNKAVVDATVANTLAIAEKSGNGCCMIGTIDPSDPALSSLKDALKGKIEYVGNILTDANTVKSVEKFGSVVLVEKRGTSRADSISEEITKLKSLQKEIVGIILA